MKANTMIDMAESAGIITTKEKTRFNEGQSFGFLECLMELTALMGEKPDISIQEAAKELHSIYLKLYSDKV